MYKYITNENILYSTENSTQSTVEIWEGNQKMRGYMFMYGYLILMYSRN